MTEELWTTDHAQCLQCHHEWQAVYALGTDALECPKCGSADTVTGDYK